MELSKLHYEIVGGNEFNKYKMIDYFQNQFHKDLKATVN